MIIKLKLSTLILTAIIALFLFTSSSYASHPFPITLKDAEDGTITTDSTVPYSPKKTCGGCHTYNTVTQGYHFQQGKDEYDPDFALNNPGSGFADFDQSPGMFGKWSPDAYRQLAKKQNDSATEIDIPVFEWAKVCGICHPGGGPMELDRDDNLYNEQAALMNDDTLDGDYYNHVQDWQNSGVLEADCLICHLQGYNILARNTQVQSGNFRAAPFAGAELGKTTDNSRVVYSSEKISLVSDMLNTKPADENCCQCHAGTPEHLFVAAGELRSDIAKRGLSWNDDNNPDVHNRAGIMCADCHTGRLKHQFAKGHDSISSVRDDLDNTIMKCSDCHSEGGYPGAPVPLHEGFTPVHLEKIDCAACHIPIKNFFAVRTMDFSAGTVINSFIGGSPEDLDNITGFKPVYFKWKSEPGGEEKIFPGNPMTFVYWNDGDDVNPVFAKKVSSAFASLPAGTVKDDTGNGLPEVNTKEEIEAMAQALKDSGVGDPKLLALKPDRNYQISHNVAPANEALGAGGCKDCHTPDSYFFSGEVMLYSYEIDETAQEVEAADQFLSMKDFSGYTQEAIDALENLDTTTTTSGICPLVLLSGGENNRTGLLREFRDHFLRKTPAGKEYISLFYKHSLETAFIIIKNSEIRFKSERILNLVIPLIQSLMDNGTITLDGKTINDIIDLCKNIQEKASPELKQTTAMLIKNLNDNTLCYSLQLDMSE